MRTNLLIALLLSTSTIIAQNNDSKISSVKFNQQREREFEQYKNEYQSFKKQRDSRHEKFKADYEAAFEKFKKNYAQFLDEQEEVINIMSYDDNLAISPLPIEHNPKVESTAAKEIQRIKIDRENLAKTSSSEFLSNLTNSKDEVEQLKEGTEKLNKINTTFETPTEKKKEENISMPKEKTLATSKIKKNNTIPSGKPTNFQRISSPFGYRIHPINWRQQYHKGVDLTAPEMTPIKATANGTITSAKRIGGYGNFIKINHENGYKTAYAHLHSISAKLNEQVKKGDIIGYVGSTGRSTGNHLHYEIYFHDQLIDPAKTF